MAAKTAYRCRGARTAVVGACTTAYGTGNFKAEAETVAAASGADRKQRDTARPELGKLKSSDVSATLTWEEELMARIFVAATLCIVLGACTAPIHMRNAATGQTATCGPYVVTWTASQRESECVGDFQRQGFELAPD
jgi:hypothetical protein